MGNLSDEELAEKWRRTIIEGQQTMNFERMVASEVDEEEVAVYNEALEAWKADGWLEQDFKEKGSFYRAAVKEERKG